MEFITFELRPRLQSCNVFILMQKKIDSNDIHIKLCENNMTLSVGQHIVNLLLPSIKIVPLSVSMLNIFDTWICFRLLTKPLASTFGSFNMEVVTDLKLSKCNKQENKTDSELSFINYECVLLCTCCKNILSKKACFERFLPFPDTNYDLSDWFCHKQHINIEAILNPQKSDYFYGLSFSILHKNIFKDCLRINKETIFCNKCLQCLGKYHTNTSFKIWNYSVDFKLLDDVLLIKSASDPLNDFIKVIKNSMSGILGEVVILESLVSEQIHYMIIKPMDWQLNLLTETKKLYDTDTISLNHSKVVKILYKYETCKHVINNDYINAKHCEVGLSVIEAGLKYLFSTTKRFPQHHRIITDFYIGHIDLEMFMD